MPLMIQNEVGWVARHMRWHCCDDGMVVVEERHPLQMAQRMVTNTRVGVKHHLGFFCALMETQELC